MATIKSYSDLQQSKRLAEILPLESADMRYGYIAPYDYSDRMFDGGYDEVPYPKDFLVKNPNFSANEYDSELPCWSLAALLDVLPKQFGRYTKSLGWFDDAWHCAYMDEDSECKYCVSADNPLDACYELILKLNELKML